MPLIRSRLRVATCALLALSGTAVAEGDWHFEAAALRYAEQGRVSVFEPLFGVRRNFADGKSLSARIVLDAITGASPTGATPSDQVQTITSSSGVSQQVTRGVVPVSSFRDRRADADLEYTQPLMRTLKATIGGSLSTETDYNSRGGTLSLAWDTADRLTTFSIGGGVNSDRVNPKGGMRPGLDLVSVSPTPGSAAKHVADGLIGITRILSPQWLMQLNYGRAQEMGYLTEPYKIVSVLNSNGSTTDYRYEKRPDRHQRQNVELTSVYQFDDENVLHFSYRYYWDDWGTKSNTIDLKYHLDIADGSYIEPHLRLYSQSAVNFFSYGIRSGAPLPPFATSDYRYGKMNTITFGAKYAVALNPGELSFRAEYMVQSGDQHPAQAVGVQKQYDLFPPVSIVILQIGYSLDR